MRETISGKRLHALPLRERIATSVAFSPDRGTLAAATVGKELLLWDLETGKPRRPLSAPGLLFQSAAFSPDGKLLAAGALLDPAVEKQYLKESVAQLWDPRTGRRVRTLRGPRGAVGEVSFSPDGRWLAAVSGHEEGNSDLRVWEVRTGKLHRLRGHRGNVLSAAFSPDGKLLASGDTEGEVRLWSVPSWKGSRKLAAGPSAVGTLSFSADSRLLACGTVLTEGAPDGAKPGEVRFWDVRTGRSLAVQPLHEGGVRAAQLSPRGRLLLSAGQNGESGVWRVLSERGAAAPAPEPKVEKIGVRGEVRSVEPVSNGVGGRAVARLLVVGRREPDTAVDQAMVTVTRSTRLLRLARGRRSPARLADVTEGKRVEVRFTGPVRESYPVQADAGEIVILD